MHRAHDSQASTIAFPNWPQNGRIERKFIQLNPLEQSNLKQKHCNMIEGEM